MTRFPDLTPAQRRTLEHLRAQPRGIRRNKPDPYGDIRPDLGWLERLVCMRKEIERREADAKGESTESI